MNPKLKYYVIPGSPRNPGIFQSFMDAGSSGMTNRVLSDADFTTKILTLDSHQRVEI